MQTRCTSIDKPPPPPRVDRCQVPSSARLEGKKPKEPYRTAGRKKGTFWWLNGCGEMSIGGTKTKPWGVMATLNRMASVAKGNPPKIHTNPDLKQKKLGGGGRAEPFLACGSFTEIYLPMERGGAASAKKNATSDCVFFGGGGVPLQNALIRDLN